MKIGTVALFARNAGISKVKSEHEERSIMKALKTKLGVNEVRTIPRFQFILASGAVHVIDFIPVDNAPGFSHRVAFDGSLTRRYLGDSFQPNQTSALDMLDMFLEDLKTTGTGGSKA